jgi:uncharacterized metal-binding protein
MTQIVLNTLSSDGRKLTIELDTVGSPILTQAMLLDDIATSLRDMVGLMRKVEHDR